MRQQVWQGVYLEMRRSACRGVDRDVSRVVLGECGGQCGSSSMVKPIQRRVRWNVWERAQWEVWHPAWREAEEAVYQRVWMEVWRVRLLLREQLR